MGFLFLTRKQENYHKYGNKNTALTFWQRMTLNPLTSLRYQAKDKK